MTPEQHIDTIRAMGTVDEAAAYVADLRGDTLNQIARLTHCTKTTADAKRAHIVDALVGNRLDWEAIRSPNWRWADQT